MPSGAGKALKGSNRFTTLAIIILCLFAEFGTLSEITCQWVTSSKFFAFWSSSHYYFTLYSILVTFIPDSESKSKYGVGCVGHPRHSISTQMAFALSLYSTFSIVISIQMWLHHCEIHIRCTVRSTSEILCSSSQNVSIHVIWSLGGDASNRLFTLANRPCDM